MPQKDLVFVVGPTRSGTTLLSLMLDHHPQLVHAGECEWMFDFARDDEPNDLPAYHDWLATNRHFRWHELAIDPSLSFRDLVRDFFDQMTAARGKSATITFGIAHRHYAQFLRTWPEAKCIHLVRDGRDVCMSWMKHGWVGNAWVGAKDWRDLLSEWRDVAASLPSDRVLSMRFEDLVRSPVASLRAITDFLGIPYDASMLEYHRDSSYGPIDAGQASKWKRAMPKRQVELFEAEAAPMLEAYGYELDTEDPRPVGRLESLPLLLDHKLNINRVRIETYGFQLWLEDHLARRIGWRSRQKQVQLRMHEITNARLQ